MSNSVTPWTPYSPWNSADENTGVGCGSRLQGIFPTQGSNPGLPHYGLPGEPQGLHVKSMLTLRGNYHTSSQSGCPILHLF